MAVALATHNMQQSATMRIQAQRQLLRVAGKYGD